MPTVTENPSGRKAQLPILHGPPDAAYISNVLGAALQQALAEVVEKRPWDPIEYLAQWLYKHKKNVEYHAKQANDSRQAASENRSAAQDDEIRQKRRNEALKIHEKEEQIWRQKEEEERKQREQEELQKKAKESLHLAQPPVLATVAEEAGEAATPETNRNTGIQKTALHEAAVSGGDVTLLLEQGTDLAQRDENGKTARDLAEELGQERVMADIDAYVADLFRNKDADKLTKLIQQNYHTFPEQSQIYGDEEEISGEDLAFYENFESQLKAAASPAE